MRRHDLKTRALWIVAGWLYALANALDALESRLLAFALWLDALRRRLDERARRR